MSTKHGWVGVSAAVCVAFFMSLGGSAAQSAACEPEKAAEKYPVYANKTVKIGVNPTYPPFSYNQSDDMSKLIGIDVEIIESAMECAGLEYEYISGPHTGLFAALFGNNIDVMLGNIFFRPDRAEKAGFVLYMVNGQSLVVGKGNPKGIRTTEDMCGLNASGAYDGTSAMVMKGISEKCVESGKAEIGWAPAPDQEPAYRALANGRIDMLMDGAASAALRIRKDEGQSMEVAFTLQTGVTSGVITPKGNEEMLKVVADGLTNIEQSGRLAELMKKYDLQEDWLIPVEVHP